MRFCGVRFDQAASVARQVPQPAEHGIRHEAAPQQPVLTELGQPGGVGDVGLAAPDIVGVAGIDHQQMTGVPGESLLAVRLVREARSLATVAVSQLQGAGMAFDLAEARLVLAQACLLDGDHGGALESAQAAWRSFLDQDRLGWAALAHYAVIRARWHDDGLGAAGGEEASRTAVELEVAGWVVAAADARLIAARNALERGPVDEAETELVAARSARRAGPAELRARAWHAEALLCLARGRERRALATLRAGLRILDEHQATLGATELRVHATSLAGDLATLGLARQFRDVNSYADAKSDVIEKIVSRAAPRLSLPSSFRWLERIPTGRAWLASLPALVHQCCQRWALDHGSPYPDSSASLVLPVRDPRATTRC